MHSPTQLIIISGKGGVGKTSIAASLGYTLSLKGKKVLFVEVNSENQLPRLLGNKGSGYQEAEVAPGLFAISITGEEAAREYLRIRLVVKLASRLLFGNPFFNYIFQYLIESIPGLTDLFTLGKVWDIQKFGHRREKRWWYDFIILDAPPSGRGLPFLKIPEVVISTLRRGPVVEEARKIQGFLSDRERVQLYIVTIPEEMAVTEAIQSFRQAEGELQIRLGPVIVNGVSPQLFKPEEKEWIKSQSSPSEPLSILVNLARVRNRREDNQRSEIKHLQDELPRVSLIEVPLLFGTSLNKDDFKRIGEILFREIKL